MTDTIAQPDMVQLTAEVGIAYLQHNSLPASEVPALLHSLHAAFCSIRDGNSVAKAEADIVTPAVPIKGSVQHDKILCLCCGKPLKSLKRHLGLHGLEPDAYRARFGLPKTYPMVAPDYSAARSQMAKAIGLGHGTHSRAAAR